MSNADFQARLQRIGTTSPQHQPIDQYASPSAEPKARKLNYTLLAVGASVMAVGFQALKYASLHYDAIRDSNGIGTALGISLASMTIVLIGIIVSMRAVVKVQKPSYGLLVVGAAVMLVGLQALKYANENYESIRDSSGIGTAAGLGLAAIAIFLVGIIVLMCAVVKRRTTPAKAAASPYSVHAAQPVRKASTGARVFFSLLGFVFGATACFYLFAAAAARFVDTETAQAVAIGSVLIALLLAFVSLLFGIVGIFLRGYALGRVPVYFLCGVVLAFATVRIFGINMLNWPQFLTMLQ